MIVSIELIKELLLCFITLYVFILLFILLPMKIIKLREERDRMEGWGPVMRENRKKHDFETWKEVQDSEVEYWNQRLFSELKNVANADAHIGTWENVKETVKGDTECADVHEEFEYDEAEWLDEIYIQIKPYFIEWLNSLLKDNEWDYYEYVNSFWDKPLEENCVDYIDETHIKFNSEKTLNAIDKYRKINNL